jgi:hypothetical protein
MHFDPFTITFFRLCSACGVPPLCFLLFAGWRDPYWVHWGSVPPSYQGPRLAEKRQSRCCHARQLQEVAGKEVLAPVCGVWTADPQPHHAGPAHHLRSKTVVTAEQILK